MGPPTTTTITSPTSPGIISVKDEWFKSYRNVPFTFSFEGEIKQAIRSCHIMQNTLECGVLKEILKEADGVAFLTVGRAGFVLTGTFGTGLVMTKDGEGHWSAPAAVAIAGSGIGLQAGGEITDAILFFKTRDAADTFRGSNQLVVGVSGGVAAGLVGRVGSWQYHNRLGTKKMALAYSFNYSKGIYAGGSLDLKLLHALEGRNQSFYGRNVSTEAILSGQVEQPVQARELYQCLNAFVEEN